MTQSLSDTEYVMPVAFLVTDHSGTASAAKKNVDKNTACVYNVCDYRIFGKDLRL